MEDDLLHSTNNTTQVTMSGLPLAIDATMRLKWPRLLFKSSLALFGVFCNTLVFIGLVGRRKKLRTPDLLLINLTAWDTVFLASRACQHIMRSLYPLCQDTSTCRSLFAFYLFLTYVTRTSFITSMISTTPIAMERCQYSSVMVKATTFNKMRRTKVVICTIVIMSLMFSLPDLLTVLCLYHVYPQNVLVADQETIWPLCTVASFNTVVSCGQLLRLTLKILAWIILLVLDSLLLYRLLRGARLARELHGEAGTPMGFNRTFNERSLTIAVVALVLMALIAYPVTGIIWALTYTSSTGWTGLVDPSVITDVQEAARIVQLIYASSNLFFLLMFGTRFRRSLLDKMHACFKCTPKSQQVFHL